MFYVCHCFPLKQLCLVEKVPKSLDLFLAESNDAIGDKSLFCTSAHWPSIHGQGIFHKAQTSVRFSLIFWSQANLTNWRSAPNIPFFCHLSKMSRSLKMVFIKVQNCQMYPNTTWESSSSWAASETLSSFFGKCKDSTSSVPSPLPVVRSSGLLLELNAFACSRLLSSGLTSIVCSSELLEIILIRSLLDAKPKILCPCTISKENWVRQTSVNLTNEA